jgi:hypothetical protein
MNTFKILDIKGRRATAVEFWPLLFKVNNKTHRLALHQTSGKTWVVSDPESGGRICEVRTNSRGIGPREAARLARANLAELVERVTADGFNRRLEVARVKYAAQSDYEAVK